MAAPEVPSISWKSVIHALPLHNLLFMQFGASHQRAIGSEHVARFAPNMVVLIKKYSDKTTMLRKHCTPRTSRHPQSPSVRFCRT